MSVVYIYIYIIGFLSLQQAHAISRLPLLEAILNCNTLGTAPTLMKQSKLGGHIKACARVCVYIYIYDDIANPAAAQWGQYPTNTYPNQAAVIYVTLNPKP